METNKETEEKIIYAKQASLSISKSKKSKTSTYVLIGFGVALAALGAASILCPIFFPGFLTVFGLTTTVGTGAAAVVSATAGGWALGIGGGAAAVLIGGGMVAAGIDKWIGSEYSEMFFKNYRDDVDGFVRVFEENFIRSLGNLSFECRKNGNPYRIHLEVDKDDKMFLEDYLERNSKESRKEAMELMDKVLEDKVKKLKKLLEKGIILTVQSLPEDLNETIKARQLESDKTNEILEQEQKNFQGYDNSNMGQRINNINVQLNYRDQ